MSFLSRLLLHFSAPTGKRRTAVLASLDSYKTKRRREEARFSNWDAARRAATAIKAEAVHHLDRDLLEFTHQAEARGTTVFWAATPERARDYILQLAQARNVRSVIKSKTNTSEEIGLNPALEQAGIIVVESDLGELIMQLRQQTATHPLYPSMHVTREEVGALFSEKLGSAPTENLEELTQIARDHLREKYRKADMGISGANFIVAETGMISITDGEGNARLVTSLPRIHVALVGIEKVVSKLSDLALLYPMISVAGAGESLGGYNSMLGGHRMVGELDGPEEFHVILLDNGRSDWLVSQRDLLYCLRCGACLSVCPLFQKADGHSTGPLAPLITPHLRTDPSWPAPCETGCAACTETCPVHIPLHKYLIRFRRPFFSRLAGRIKRRLRLGLRDRL